MREERRNPAIEDAIVKTVAAFLNTDGGTLLIGVGPDGSIVGLELDYPHVKPPNGDGFVNWLTTHLANALGAAAVMRTRARVVAHAGVELCRLDVAASSRPIWAKTSKEPRVFFVRMNNSSRAMPEIELEAYLADRWPVPDRLGERLARLPMRRGRDPRLEIESSRAQSSTRAGRAPSGIRDDVEDHPSDGRNPRCSIPLRPISHELCRLYRENERRRQPYG